jgi:sugar O-acyltransferase (sialic acid O-acetyltransferase NeuD family)
VKRLAILGASGHGKVIADAALLAEWDDVIFYDDAWPSCKANGDWPVVGDTNALLDSIGRYDGVIVAIGNNLIRQKKCFELKQASSPLVSIIHPKAIISKHSKIGIGSFIAASAVLNIDSIIGEFVIINTAAVIEHDCYIGNACHISPSASLAGGVNLGERSWVGINATVRQLVKLGDDVIVGAGSVVVKDVQSGATVVGNPARILNK